MALKAGYIGVKKSMLGLINSISSAKIIKTIGNGLKLTSAGTLSADIDTNTLEFKNGKLAAKSKGIVYDVSEEITSQVIGSYKDSSGEKELKRAYVTFSSVTPGNWNRKSVSDLNISKVVEMGGIVHTTSNGDWSLGYRDSTKSFIVVYDPTLGLSFYLGSDSIFNGSNVVIFIDYIEAEEE